MNNQTTPDTALKARELLAAEWQPRSPLERQWLMEPEDGCDVLIPAKIALRAIEAALTTIGQEKREVLEEAAKVADAYGAPYEALLLALADYGPMTNGAQQRQSVRQHRAAARQIAITIRALAKE